MSSGQQPSRPQPGQQPVPYGQQPVPYGQQPVPYGQQPVPYGQQPPPVSPPSGQQAYPPHPAVQQGYGQPPPFAGAPHQPPIPPRPGQPPHLAAGSQPPRRKSRVPLILGIVGLVVVLVVGGLVVRTVVVSNASETAKREAALGFFAALQRADAAAAMSYAADPIADTSLLTDAVLSKSAEIAPITNVEVKRTTDDTVTLTMNVLGKQHQEQYDVVQRDGQWKMVQAVRTFEVLAGDLQDVTPILNGATPKDPLRLTLFPGVYEITTGSPYLTWRQPQQIFLHGIPGNDPIFGLQMSDEGKVAATQAVNDAVNTCVTRKELAPEGCPFAMKLDAGSTLVAGTVRWSLVDPPQWRAGAVGPLFKGTLTLHLRLQFDYTVAGTKHSYDKTADVDVRNVAADLSNKDIKISWG